MTAAEVPQDDAMDLWFCFRRLCHQARTGVGWVQDVFLPSACSRLGFHNAFNNLGSASKTGEYARGLLGEFSERVRDYNRNFQNFRLALLVLTVGICLLLVLLGQCGRIMYTIMAVPVWYFSSFMVTTCPFLYIYKFDGCMSSNTIWIVLSGTSFLISAIECTIGTKSSNLAKSWVMGNILFAVVSVGILPASFVLKKSEVRRTSLPHSIEAEPFQPSKQEQFPYKANARRAGSTSTELDDLYASDDLTTEEVKVCSPSLWPSETQLRRCNSSGDVLAARSPLDEGPDSRSSEYGVSSKNAPDQGLGRQTNWCRAPVEDCFTSTASSFQSQAPVRSMSNASQESQQKSWIVVVTALFVILGGMVMWASYFWHPDGSSSSSKSPSLPTMYQYWRVMCLLVPIVIVVYTRDRHKQLRYHFGYLLFYCVVMTRVPEFLGHFILFFMEGVRETVDQHAPGLQAWMQLAVSLLYVVAMQGYFVMLAGVVRNMTEQSAFPAFLFLGQLYFYMFWYLLVGNDQPIDRAYWAVLFFNNVHVVLTNTGFYRDAFSTAENLLKYPLSPCLRLTSINCYRAAIVARKNRKDSSEIDLDSDEEQSLLAEGSSEGLTGTPLKRKTLGNFIEPRRSVKQPLTDREMRPLAFLVTMAEQDNIADSTALIVVPSVLTILSIFDAPGKGSMFPHKSNMWLRCLFMYIGRLLSGKLARSILSRKLRKRSQQIMLPEEALEIYRIDRLVMQGFRDHLWYLLAVTIVCTCACFQKFEYPARFAFLD